MKRFLSFIILMLGAWGFSSCEKETLLIIEQTSLDFPDAGGTSTIILTANKHWTASSDQAWCSVSPASGDEVSCSKITISCNENPEYDGRNCTITFTCEEKVTVVSVSQSNASGLFVTTPGYELSNEKHTLTVEVKANVEYEVNPEVDWIRYAGTKGLSTSQIILEIDANESFDGREGKVSVKQKNGGLSGTITIRQDSSKGLFVTPTEYNLSNESQTIEVEVKYNVEFTAVIPTDCQDWVTVTGTKGLSSTTYSVSIAKNETFDYREGSITFKQNDGALSGTVLIRQEPKEPSTIAIDLKEDTGRDETMFLLDDGSYYLYESLEEGTFHSLYYNPFIGNELSEGIHFTANDKDGIITMTYKDECFIINKVGETTYNLALRKEDGSVQYWYGVEYDDDTVNDFGADPYNPLLTKAMSESDKHFYKWFAYKGVFIISTAFGTVTSGPYVGIATLIPTIYFELCRSGIIKVNDDLEKEFLHGTENVLSINNVVMNSVKWTQLLENEKFVMNYSGGILSLLSLLNNAADKEFELIGRIEEVVKPELGDEWNIKLSPQVVTFQNANEQHIVQVSSKAMWKVDDSTVDHSWCSVEKVDDHIVVTVKENEMSSSNQTCYATIMQAVESNTYHIAPVKLFIVQNNLKFSLSEKELVFGKNGGSKPVQVEYSDNIKSWRVTQWPDWCTIDQQETWSYRASTFWVNAKASEVGHEPSTIVVTGYLEGGGYIDVSLSVWQDVSDDYELRQKLIKFFNDTGGPNWKRNDNWCSDKPLDEWYGIDYKDNVLKITLEHNNLTGNATLSGCTSLAELDVFDNQLQSLDISECVFLTWLSCNSNQLQSLDASGCTSLEVLYCHGSQLQSLSVSGCISLTYLRCNDNLLKTLDVSGCTSLKEIYCHDNKMTLLQTNGCDSLNTIKCHNNQFVDLVIKNLPSLVTVQFGNDQLVKIDFSGCTSLENLFYNSRGDLEYINLSGCSSYEESNPFSSSKKAYYINLSGTAIKSLQYQEFDCLNLDVSNCKQLKTISLLSISLSGLSLLGCSLLEGLEINECNLHSLDVTDCSSLSVINCLYSEIQSLIATGCLQLSGVALRYSQLRLLDISGCPSLKGIRCRGYDGNNVDTVNVSNCIAIERISCQEARVKFLDVSGCISLKQLDCYTNQLQSLDLFNCSELYDIDCHNNQLQLLDVSGCSSLSNLYCYNNQLQSLDVSGCSSLSNLSCSDNQLQSLDVSVCSSLSMLNCMNNHITQMITIEDRIYDFYHDCLYSYWNEWDEASKSLIKKWKRNDYGWYYPGEPEKGYHGR